MTRKAALTVRLPGARIAPAKSTWTCGHRRLENSGTKGLSRCSIVVGRVRIITSLWRTGDDRTLPLLTLTKWTKSSGRLCLLCHLNRFVPRGSGCGLCLDDATPKTRVSRPPDVASPDNNTYHY